MSREASKRWIWRIAVLVSCILLLGTSAAAQDLKLGKKTFKTHCVECHGKEGRGDGEKARRSGFEPRDLSLGSFKCRCTPSGRLPTDEDLLRSIVEGLPGAPMPAHRELSVEESSSVVAYTKTFSSRFEEEEAPGCIVIPEPSPSTPDLIEEGRRIYQLMSCGSCHGAEGRADGPSAETLTDDWGRPIEVHNFVKSKKFKCGGDPSDLYRTLHTGLNGTPMPSYADAFLFPAEAGASLDRGSWSGDETAALDSYLESQPDRATLESMQPAERQALVEQRTWALVYFLRSLVPAE